MRAEAVDISNGYWRNLSYELIEGMRMHDLSGQLRKDPETNTRPWANVTQHGLVESARNGVLGNWIRLGGDVVTDMKMAGLLEDFYKIDEVRSRETAFAAGTSPVVAIRDSYYRGAQLLRDNGFSERVVWLADATGGDTPQLVETQRILDKDTLTDDEWAFLVVHYVDDCSIGSNWIRPSEIVDGRRVNVLDYKKAMLTANNAYQRIAEEITAELTGIPQFAGMNSFDSWHGVSRSIEQKLAVRIEALSGESVNPYLIPELTDQRIRTAIENYQGGPEIYYFS